MHLRLLFEAGLNGSTLARTSQRIESEMAVPARRS